MNEGKRKTYHYQNWVNEFMITELALQKLLGGIIQTEEKEN